LPDIILRIKPLSYLFIAALFFLSPANALCKTVEEKKLSLSDCVALALENAAAAKKAHLALRLQGKDVLRSYGSFLPTITVSGTYTPYALQKSYTPSNSTDIDRIRSESESADLAVSTSLNLFNGFRNYAALQSALEKERAAGYSLTRALQTVAFDVTQSYYQVLLDNDLLRIARENLLAARDQLTLTDRQYQIGLKSQIDLLQQQADAAASGLSLIKAENRFQRSTLELLRRLRIDPHAKLILEPVAPETRLPLPSKPDIDSLCSLALEKRSDLKSREYETDAAKWQITEARGALLPRIDLNFRVATGGTGFLRQSVNDGPEFEYPLPPLADQLDGSLGYAVSLNLSWPLFDGFRNSYAIEAAKISHLNERIDLEELKNNIVIDLRQAAGDYAAAFSEIETAEVNLKSAQSAYNGIKRKYELGAAGFTDLSAARAALFSARSSLSQASWNLALQKTVLDFTTGTLPVQ
jgi:outer membrane protein